MELKKIAKKIFWVLLFIIIMDLSIGYFLQQRYFDLKSGFRYKASYTINNTKADILIFGASKACHSYVSKIISDSLNMTCYNAGVEGQYLFYHYSQFRSVLNRYKPKIVILDVRILDFIYRPNSYDVITDILPFYYTNKDLRPIIKLKGPYEPIKLLSSIYPFNSQYLTLFFGLDDYKYVGLKDYNGFIPLNGKLSKDTKIITIDRPYTSKYKFDNNKIHYFEQFLSDATSNNIKLYLIRSPFYFRIGSSDRTDSIINHYATKYNINFYNFTQTKPFDNNPQLFNDLEHLNHNGAVFYSRKIASVIKKDYFKN